MADLTLLCKDDSFGCDACTKCDLNTDEIAQDHRAYMVAHGNPGFTTDLSPISCYIGMYGPPVSEPGSLRGCELQTVKAYTFYDKVSKTCLRADVIQDGASHHPQYARCTGGKETEDGPPLRQIPCPDFSAGCDYCPRNSQCCNARQPNYCDPDGSPPGPRGPFC